MASENSEYDDSGRKRKAIDPPEDEKKLRVNVCELLKCPVCFNTTYPPVYQCLNGHLLCSGCKSGMENRCPTCWQELDKIMCLTLEKLVKHLEQCCKHQKLGCLDVVPCCNKLNHESKCSLGLYDCPGSSFCSVRGDIPFLVSHLKKFHKAKNYSLSTTFVQSFTDRDADKLVNSSWIPLWLGTELLSVFRKVSARSGIHLQLMGDEEEAKTYRYSLEFGANERKTIWQGVPRSIRESQLKVRDSLNGLVIERNLFFGRENEKELAFKVNVDIWKA